MAFVTFPISNEYLSKWLNAGVPNDFTMPVIVITKADVINVIPGDAASTTLTEKLVLK